MRTFLASLLLIFAGVLAGCSSTMNASDGAGYSRLTMKPETRNFVVRNDEPFARQVVAHNEQCARDPLCTK